MKYFVVKSFFISASLMMLSCGGEEPNEEASFTQKASPLETYESLESEEEVLVDASPKVVIALWNSSIKEEGKQKSKWKASYKYGEQLTLLGESVQEGKRTFLKVRTEKGTEGWTSDYLVAENAQYGVITEEVVIYTKPSPIGVSTKKLFPGDFVAISNKQTKNYYEFWGKEKLKKGWIKKGFSFDTTDIEVAQFREHILNEKDEERKKLLLLELEDNITYIKSSFYDIIKKENAPVKDEEEILLTETVIEGNLDEEPISEIYEEELINGYIQETGIKDTIEVD